MAGNTPGVNAYGPVIRDDITFYQGHALGNVNPGDFLIYSGHYVIPTAVTAANALQCHASAAGIATQSNPVYDSHGAQRQNTALIYADNVRLAVSAFHKVTASSHFTLGTRVNPSTTGSAVGYPTGVTGVGAQWGTAAIASYSGATAGAPLGFGIITKLLSLGTDSGESQFEILFQAHGNLGYGG